MRGLKLTYLTLYFKELILHTAVFSFNKELANVTKLHIPVSLSVLWRTKFQQIVSDVNKNCIRIFHDYI